MKKRPLKLAPAIPTIAALAEEIAQRLADFENAKRRIQTEAVQHAHGEPSPVIRAVTRSAFQLDAERRTDDEAHAVAAWAAQRATAIVTGNPSLSPLPLNVPRDGIDRLILMLTWCKRAALSGAAPAAGGGEATHSKPKRNRAKWLAEAMLLVKDHPERSDSEIAKRVGRDKSSLSRSTEYQAAAAIARGQKSDRPSGHVVLGEKHGPTDVEAEAPKLGGRIPGSRCYRGKCPECGTDTRVERPDLAETVHCESCQ